ncbi:MAG: hypothetical protein GX900_07010 [Clostridiaceae bacterium]|nr:hypothetical protein [Clostridiaceae bacterium]
MIINCVWEHNQNDSLLYSSNVIGAFTRGATIEEALNKMPVEIRSFLLWAGENPPPSFEVRISQEKSSEIDICDADSDVIFDSERVGLTADEYKRIKALVLKSAQDFLTLYEAFPDKDKTVLLPRKTFYGSVPRTASEMYLHTKNVNAYYWGEVGITASNEGSVLENRRRGFELLELHGNPLSGEVYEGSYGEQWSVPKVLRRFIWHDRIHAKAMYRMGLKTFGEDVIPNIFKFDLP